MSATSTVLCIAITKIVMQRWTDREKHKAWPYVGVTEHVAVQARRKPNESRSIRPAYVK